MKKVFSFTFLLLLLFLVFQFFINFLKTEHNVMYVLNIDEKMYEITESYKKTSSADYYFFEVNYNGSEFLFEVDNFFNKQKQVIEDINSYVENDLICLSLVYTNGDESNLLCSKEGALYSPYSLIDQYELTSSIVKSSIFAEESEEFITKKFTINKDYLYKNEILLLYNYKHILKYYGEFTESLIFSLYDNYQNTLGVLVDKYYVIPKYTSKPEFSLYLAFDVETGIIREMTPPNVISKQSYVMGVYEDKVYIFDKSNLAQYVIDPYAKTVELIGSIDKNGVVLRNNVLEEVSVYEISKDELIFEKGYDDYKELEYDQIFEFEKYSIYVKENNFYKVYKNYLNKPIFLFSTSNFKEVKAIGDKIYYIVDDTLYRYDENGIYPIVKNEEFKYNYLNIYDVYFVEE